jgi:hypothetical protein
MFLALFAVMNFILKRKSTPIYIPLIFIAIYVSAGFIKYVSVKTTSEIIVYNSPVAKQIGIRNGTRLTVYSDTIYAGPEAKKHCASLGLRLSVQKIDKDPYYLDAGKSRVLICSDPWKLAEMNPPPQILILTGRMKKDKLQINAAEIVSLSAGIYKPDNDLVSFHSIRSSGAYRKAL